MSIFLAGDVGGTKTLFRLVRSSGESPRLETLQEASYPSQEFTDLVPMARRFLEAASEPRLEVACFALAGPEKDGVWALTNLSWSLIAERLEHELGIPKVLLINDFAAVGQGVVGLGAEHLLTLQPGRPDPAAPIAVIGAGTGLGQGFLIPEPDGHRVFASEGGHADFAPRTALELRLLAHLREKHRLDHVSVERVVSGPGIVSIYEFLRADEPEPRSKTVDLAAEISRAALAGTDELCCETMRIFIEAYGAEAGNLALKLLAYGGLYVAGGIAIKNLPLLENGGFLEAFRAKGRLRPMLEQVPVHVVLDPKVGLLGAALVAARQVQHWLP